MIYKMPKEASKENGYVTPDYQTGDSDDELDTTEYWAKVEARQRRDAEKRRKKASQK